MNSRVLVDLKLTNRMIFYPKLTDSKDLLNLQLTNVKGFVDLNLKNSKKNLMLSWTTV